MTIRQSRFLALLLALTLMISMIPGGRVLATAAEEGTTGSITNGETNVRE